MRNADYTIEARGCKAKVWRYASIESAITGFSSREEHKRIWEQWSGSGFYGADATAANAWDKALVGDSSLVERAEKLLESFSVDAHTTRTKRENWLFGAVPNVPAYLSGSPYSMRRKIKYQDDTAPLTICASLSTSAGISADLLMQRGTAILALVMKLAELRPIKLQLFHEAGNGGSTNLFQVFDVQTQPLALANACHALTSANYQRGIALCLQDLCGMPSYGPWPRNRHDIMAYRAYLQLGEEDLLIMGAHISEFNNPHEWLKKQLAKYGEQPEE